MVEMRVSIMVMVGVCVWVVLRSKPNTEIRVEVWIRGLVRG